MILHANAALSRRQRERLVRLVFAGVTITAAAIVVGCSRQTASKWVGRARRGEGLEDRSSRPRRSPRRTPAAVEQAVLRARAVLGLGPTRSAVRSGSQARRGSRSRPQRGWSAVLRQAHRNARRSLPTSEHRPRERDRGDLRHGARQCSIGNWHDLQAIGIRGGLDPSGLVGTRR
jgi:transposase-like protein